MNNAFDDESLSFDVVEKKLTDMEYWAKRISLSLMRQNRYLEAESILRIANNLSAVRCV